MTFKDRLGLWLLGLFLELPLMLLPLLGKGGLVIDVIAGAIFLSALCGLICFGLALGKPLPKRQNRERHG